MSGAVERRPARKATARAERRNREKNRLRVFLISRMASTLMYFGFLAMPVCLLSLSI